MNKPTLGSHWEETAYSELYQLYRRVEDVAVGLEKRRKNGWTATKPFIAELNVIASKLRSLDKKVVVPPSKFKNASESKQ